MKLFNMAVWLTSGLVLLVSTSYFYGSQQNQQQPTPTHVHLNQTHMTVTPTTTTATANDSTTIRKLTPPEDFFFNSAPISFTHIPKCAGTSFVKQFSPRLHNQECYDASVAQMLLMWCSFDLPDPMSNPSSCFAKSRIGGEDRSKAEAIPTQVTTRPISRLGWTTF